MSSRKSSPTIKRPREDDITDTMSSNSQALKPTDADSRPSTTGVKRRKHAPDVADDAKERDSSPDRSMSDLDEEGDDGDAFAGRPRHGNWNHGVASGGLRTSFGSVSLGSLLKAKALIPSTATKTSSSSAGPSASAETHFSLGPQIVRQVDTSEPESPGLVHPDQSSPQGFGEDATAPQPMSIDSDNIPTSGKTHVEDMAPSVPNTDGTNRPQAQAETQDKDRLEKSDDSPGKPGAEDSDDSPEAVSPSGSDTADAKGAEVGTDRGRVSQDGSVDTEDLDTLIPSSDDDIEQQRIYFPGADTGTDMCLFCAGKGHRAAKCPALDCSHCGGRHHILACPAMERCGKCRQLGHGASSCQEKLKLTQSDGLCCALCLEPGHLERNCDLVWRSFAPPSDVIKKVRQLPVYCYSCGAKGHYGPECVMRNSRGPRATGDKTWSRQNHDKFVDAKSSEMPISWPSDSPAGNERLRIRGRARVTQGNHIYFTDSDEDDEFIRPPIQRSHQANSRVSNSVQVEVKSKWSRLDANGATAPADSDDEYSPPPAVPPPEPRRPSYASASEGGSSNRGGHGQKQSGSRNAGSYPQSLPQRPPPSMVSAHGRAGGRGGGNQGRRPQQYQERQQQQPPQQRGGGHAGGRGRGNTNSQQGRNASQSGRGHGHDQKQQHHQPRQQYNNNQRGGGGRGRGRRAG